VAGSTAWPGPRIDIAIASNGTATPVAGPNAGPAGAA
jgi:hypothetical protein